MKTQKLQEIIEKIKEFKQRGLSKLSDNTIMDVSVRIYNSEQIDAHRQGLNRKADSPLFRKPQSSSSPATSGQINLLKRLGVTNTLGLANLSKKQASEMIDELKRKKK